MNCSTPGLPALHHLSNRVLVILDGLMVKLKFQYFGHLMQRADSFEKTLMLGKIEGRRRRGRQRMRWLDGITDLMDMVWVDSGSWWWTGRPGVLQFMRSQSQTQLSDWMELNWLSSKWSYYHLNSGQSKPGFQSVTHWLTSSFSITWECWIWNLEWDTAICILRSCPGDSWYTLKLENCWFVLQIEEYYGLRRAILWVERFICEPWLPSFLELSIRFSSVC